MGRKTQKTMVGNFGFVPFSDRLEKELRWHNNNYGRKATWRMTVYMVNKTGYIKINFPGTQPEEVINFIRSMEANGFCECSWLTWVFKKWWLQVKCWWRRRPVDKVNIKGQRGLTISIGE